MDSVTLVVTEGVLKHKDCRHCKKPFEYLQVGRRFRIICDDCGPTPGGTENAGIAKKRRNMAHRYGIKLSEYNALMERCGGVCEACGSGPTHEGTTSQRALHVDHDHDTGEIRGMLCYRCNLALGYVADDVNRLKGLISYLGG